MNATDVHLMIESLVVLINGVVVPWAIVAYQKRTGVQVTDQQRAAVQAALVTAAGIIQTKMDQRVLSVAEIKPENPIVLAEAGAALATVPISAAAEGTTQAVAARIIVGQVNTKSVPLT